MKEIDIVKQALINLIESSIYSEETINSYFSPQYTQQVDGKTLCYNAFCKHIKLLKEITHKRRLTINNIISQNNTVFTNHTVEIIADNKYSKVKVIAMFIVEDSKIISCDELTFLIEGDDKNKNIGSIT